MTGNVKFIDRNMFKPINKISVTHRINQYLTGIWHRDNLEIFYTNYYKQSKRYYHWWARFSKKDTDILRDILGEFLSDVTKKIIGKKYENPNIHLQYTTMSNVAEKKDYLSRIDRNEDGSYDIYYTSIYKPSNMHYSRYIHLTKNF